MKLFKHFKRLMHGAAAVGLLVGIISLILGICSLIDDFIKWRYQDDAFEVFFVLTILYLIGLLVELFQ